ncbi:hypothetical protein SLE2022_010880 [Rubroshorea leprosula]
MASMFSTHEAFNIAFKFLSTSASLAGIWMLLRTVAGEVILQELKSYFLFFFHYCFTLPSPNLTLVIDESSRMPRDEVYDAARLYLAGKTSPKTKRVRLSKSKRQEHFALSVEKDEEIIDDFEGTEFKWKYKSIQPPGPANEEKNFFELTFNRKFLDKVLDSYLDHVLDSAKEIEEKTKVVKIYSRQFPRRHNDIWGSMILGHPATFDNVAMAPGQREMIIDDLNRFVERREYYKRVGKAWKRGYLLYGPPGTGKSSLIAAMANYLKFDIYDMELATMHSDSDLKRVLLSTTNRSILAIEDMDCGIKLPDRENHWASDKLHRKLTLSGLLNFIDGLWSSCGDAKIIVVTTNNKDRLDPSLLRPGRMDVQINLSYCTVDAVRILASNYLDISTRDHPLFGKVESLIENTEVTPAEVAGELMKNEGVDLALQGLVSFLERTRSGCDKIEEQVAEIGEANSLTSGIRIDEDQVE